MPIAIDSLGLFCSDGITFLIELGHRMTMVTGDVRETAHMFQRLSVAVQHFNRVRFRCSFGATVYDVGDYIYLILFMHAHSIYSKFYWHK